MTERIQRKRTRGWRMPENTVYVGRPSKWGNPFEIRLEEKCKCCGTVIQEEITSHEVLRDYRYFLRHPQSLHGWDMPSVEDIQKELRGKNLACWCALDKPCHADILLELANE